MKSLFLKRVYPEKRIDNKMRKVKFCKEGIKRLKELNTICCYKPRPIKKSRKNNKSKLLFIKHE